MSIKTPSTSWVEHGYGTRFQGFQNLMRQRVRDILLVSSLYDLYLFEEDGRLYELIRNEYLGLQLSHAPELSRVSSGYEALSILKNEVVKFDLIITTLHIEDMTPIQFAELLKRENIDTPLILLAFDNRELNDLITYNDISAFNKLFIWNGDYRLIIGIVKFIEDTMNIDHDTKIVGVQSIILIEDNIRYYSSFLPIIYTELIKQSKRLISEGINLSHKFLRMRARPKIILCSSYEEAWEHFKEYEDYILGIISDIDFYKEGKLHRRAGIEFAEKVKELHDDIPILLQSSDSSYEDEAKRMGVSFLRKGSPTLMQELRDFMVEYFSFGDFVFRLPSGEEVGRATDLKSITEQLQIVPDESLVYHAERNHFSNWFKARTEFWLADRVRPKKVSDFPSPNELRAMLINMLVEYQKVRLRAIITDFDETTFDPTGSFSRIGGGSLGGKARGLGFLKSLFNNYNIRNKYESVKISVPTALVIGTDVFDQFLDDNDLRAFALNTNDDELIKQKFIEAKNFPHEIEQQLALFLSFIKTPLAVRSSSLLEDSQYHPFAGVYATYMIPNNNPENDKRLQELLTSIKLVYASTFCADAKAYIDATAYRLEEEKMAVIVQCMVGTSHSSRFYPDISGVAKSHNFYPISPMKAEDGIVALSLGLGKMVVEGGQALRFCPKYPNHIIQLHSPKEALANNQRNFYAIDLTKHAEYKQGLFTDSVKLFDISSAEQDGSLQYCGSTYSPENDRIYEGTFREGIRIVSFAPVLQQKLFPLPEILELLMDMGKWGMGTPVEIEFAVNINRDANSPIDFGVLQMRPLVIGQEVSDLNIDDVNPSEILCSCGEVMGNGILNTIKDVVFVDFNIFDRSKTRNIASEVSYFNTKLLREGAPYILIGPGRWGTLDPWLGIPITWSQISGAHTIVEAGMKDIAVAPSQGSHFFQNITSFMVGYFSVGFNDKKSFIDWDWLHNIQPLESKQFVHHLRFENPLTVKMNGKHNQGVIIKPEILPNG